ncbi:hypothetical protein HAX54_047118 [Datura stramonium]|uniref:Glutaredoxin domain-containing protein n=1 Tax=Datura stramonium TaxID=4076 RepID=A0ABS8WLN8_DATST|nr:hypothetical protein [Datura stramonium]
MDAGFMEELKTILGVREKTKLSLPRIFIGGRYIGGAEEIRQLHEAGELKKYVEGLIPADFSTCGVCGGHRFILCDECSGSHKCYSEKGGFRTCTACNENGLIRKLVSVFIVLTQYLPAIEEQIEIDKEVGMCDIHTLFSDDSNYNSPVASTPKKPNIFHRVLRVTAVLRAFSIRPAPDSSTPKETHNLIQIPGAEKKIVIYFTSLRVIRSTFDDCKAVRSISE